jgi:hypothetical protein
MLAPVRTILIAFTLSLPALAWEPQSPAAVQSRIEELQKAWAGKTPDEIAQDKIARSRQPRPQWTSRSAWKMELGPVTYYFAVGKAGFPRASAAGAQDTGSSAPPGRPLDWWYDDGAAIFYTLVVDAR